MTPTLAAAGIALGLLGVAARGAEPKFRVVPVHPLIKVARDAGNLPAEAPDRITLRVCRGERRSVQVVVVASEDVTVSVDNAWRFRSGTRESLEEMARRKRPLAMGIRPVRYVPAKHPKEPERMGGLWPDCLDEPSGPTDGVAIAAGQAQPFWISFDIPRDCPPGLRHESLAVSECLGPNVYGHQALVPLDVEVVDITLPQPSDFRFLLDLWQNQGRIARQYELETWSDAHWDMLKVYTADLARYGQDYITVGRHLFTWTKTRDGWEFGYDLFDRYVELCMGLGIDRGIEYLQLFNGRGDQGVSYRDEAAGKEVSYRCNVGDPEWDEPYLAFLTDFARHLREKGWFDRTWVCPTDEPQDVYTGRALSDFAHATELLRQADSEFRTTVAIDKLDSAVKLQPYIDRYVFKLRQDVYSREFAQARLAEGKRVEWYICCHPERPNTFITGDLCEAVDIGWMTYREGLGGLLRWSYTAWPDDPFDQPEGDGRYTAGDLFIVYPGEKGPLASVRWEALLEGIQDFELLHMLEDEIEVARQAGLSQEAELAETGMARAVKLVAGERRTLLDYSTNPSDIDRAREWVTERILRLRETTAQPR